MSCLSFLNCTGSKKKSNESNNNRQPNLGIRADQVSTHNNNRNSAERYESQSSRQQRLNRINSENQQSQEDQEQEVEQVKLSNIVIKSKFPFDNIIFSDFLPEDREGRHQYKYYCPICLRYFNHVLQSECCLNYLCVFCANDIVKKEEDVEKYQARCPYNCEGVFTLNDVNPDGKVKHYSDSQNMSFFSNQIGRGTLGSQIGMKFGQTDQGFQDHNIQIDPNGNKEHINIDDNNNNNQQQQDEDNLERAVYNPGIDINMQQSENVAQNQSNKDQQQQLAVVQPQQKNIRFAQSVPNGFKNLQSQNLEMVGEELHHEEESRHNVSDSIIQQSIQM